MRLRSSATANQDESNARGAHQKRCKARKRRANKTRSANKKRSVPMTSETSTFRCTSALAFWPARSFISGRLYIQFVAVFLAAFTELLGRRKPKEQPEQYTLYVSKLSSEYPSCSAHLFYSIFFITKEGKAIITDLKEPVRHSRRLSLSAFTKSQRHFLSERKTRLET